MTANDNLFAAASGDPGSAGAEAPDSGQANQGEVDLDALIKENENLKKVLGQQGQELGQYREFVTKIEPFAEKVESIPSLFDAIMSDKFSEEVVRMVAEGKISQKEAKDAQRVQAEVKKEVAKMSPDDLNELIRAQVEAAMPSVDTAVGTKVEEFRIEQRQIADAAEFIEKTEDFQAYADEVHSYLESHPDLMDVSEAYYSVKGRLLTEAAAEKARENAAEISKNVAVGSVPGGGTRRQAVQDSGGMADSLFGTAVSPTSLL